MLPRQVKIASAPRPLVLQHIPCWHGVQSITGARDEAVALHARLQQLPGCEMGRVCPRNPQAAPPSAGGRRSWLSTALFSRPDMDRDRSQGLHAQHSSKQPWQELRALLFCNLCVPFGTVTIYVFYWTKPPSAHPSASCLSLLFLALVRHLQNLTPNLLIVLTTHCIKCKEYCLETIQCPFPLSSCPSETPCSSWHCPLAKPQLGARISVCFLYRKKYKKTTPLNKLPYPFICQANIWVFLFHSCTRVSFLFPLY